MPVILPAFPSAARTGRPSASYWAEWLDGQPRLFEAGVDFEESVDAFVKRARQAAFRRDLSLQVHRPQGEPLLVVIQAKPKFDMTAELRAHLARNRRRRRG